jgi:hypothetical protein
MSTNTPPTDEQLLFIQYRAEGKTLRDCVQLMQKPLSTLGDWNQTFQLVIQPLRQEFLKNHYNITLENSLGRYQWLQHEIEENIQTRTMQHLDMKSLCNLYLKVIECQHKIIET